MTGTTDPYKEMTEDDYARMYTARLVVTPVNDETMVFSGICPRCGCACTFVAARRAYRWRPRGRVRGAVGIPMYCTCTTEHPGRPVNEKGCGAYWNVNLDRT